MQFISHRGYWKTTTEKNFPIAFKRSFGLGFGTETDLRDYAEEVVISHDIANAQSISLHELFSIYCGYDKKIPLALNIKSDGLQQKLKAALEQFGIENYFVFDMSIPDTLSYIKEGIRFFSRQSEYEPIPAFYKECDGIWLDAFTGNWYNTSIIKEHLSQHKQVAIVSPDLHKRDVAALWSQLKNNGIHELDDVILCTDIPEKAIEFFKL